MVGLALLAATKQHYPDIDRVFAHHVISLATWAGGKVTAKTAPAACQRAKSELRIHRKEN
jgi:hypothetical protein